MQSFRTELENPIVQKDILELANKIELFHNGKINEEKFRSIFESQNTMLQILEAPRCRQGHRNAQTQFLCSDNVPIICFSGTD